MPDIITFGEMLIDFVPTVSGVSLIEAPAFKKAPGGAPANVAAGLSKLGVSSGFVGQVGDDAFGHFLAQTLQELGVDTSSLCFSTEARTALAFVTLRADGEREFMFYHHPSADMLYTPDQVPVSYIQQAKVFHYGSISLIEEPVRSATLRALEVAREAGLLISYDPNLRLSLWPDAEAAKEGILLGWPYAHVIKVSEEELAFLDLTGLKDLTGLMIVTRGKRGCTYVTPHCSGEVAGFPVEAVDTTGAGDGFVAGMLKGLLEQPQAAQDEEALRQICRYANAVGAITTTQRGAIPALPVAKEVEEFLR